MIADRDFQKAYRQKPTDFVRDRVLSFSKVVVGLINLMNRSIAVELAKLLQHLHGMAAPLCSKQAFSQQRQKLKPEAFVALNQQLITQFYADGNFEKFHGFRLLAMDGSTLELPESQEVVEYYGRASNQETSLPMARCSLVHDVVNQITLHAILAPYLSDDRAMGWQHLHWLQTSITDEFASLLLLDRGYPSIDLIAQLQAQGMAFIMRVSEQCSLQEIRDFAASGQRQVTITLDVTTPKRRKNQRLQAALQQLDYAPLVVRLLSIDLPDGNKEYLLSNLLDDRTAERQYTLDFFYDAYRKRWGVETQYAFDKTLLEIENFSSKKVVGIQQDFYASILCRNINALLNVDAQEHIRTTERQQQANGKANKQIYQVNRAVSLGLIKDQIASMLFGTQPLEASYDKLVAQISRNKSLSKPDRHFSRKRKRPRKPKINRRRPT
jgi:hypothetical protein